MTNHCPSKPARILIPAEFEKKINDFSEMILERITDFAEEYSMDEMMILDSAILDNWMDCPRCESAICELQGHAYGMVISKIKSFLNGEL